MSLTFYPHSDDVGHGSIDERVELLMEAAGRYKAVILDEATKAEAKDPNKRMIPKELNAAYNWQEIAGVLHEIRDLPEGSKSDKLAKADLLTKLAEIYEVLRAAKMSKLEAVRLALINEANQLRGAAASGT